MTSANKHLEKKVSLRFPSAINIQKRGKTLDSQDAEFRWGYLVRVQIFPLQISMPMLISLYFLKRHRRIRVHEGFEICTLFFRLKSE